MDTPGEPPRPPPEIALRVGPDAVWLHLGDGPAEAPVSASPAGSEPDSEPATGGSGEPRFVAGRTAVLLAHLALIGPLPRTRAAALLYPDTPPRRARANLRQLLHRFDAGSQLLTEATDPLELHPRVRIAAVVEPLPTLGAGDDGAGGRETELALAAERWRRERRDAHHDELQRAAAAGRVGDAVAAARRLAEVAPDDERRLGVAAATLERLAVPEAREAARAIRRDLQRRLLELGVRLDADAGASTGATPGGGGDLEAGTEPGGDARRSPWNDPSGRRGVAFLLAHAARFEGADGAAAVRTLTATRARWSDAWRRAAAAPEPELLERAAAPLARWAERSGLLRDGVALLVQGASLLRADLPRQRRAAAALRVHAAWLKHRAGLADAADDARRALDQLGAYDRDDRAADADDDALLRAEAHHVLGAIAWSEGDAAEARRRWQQAHEISVVAEPRSAASDLLRTMRLHGNLAMAADALGERQRATQHYRAALAAAEATGAVEAEAIYLTNLGQVELERGDLAAARRVLERGLAHVRRYRLTSTEPYLLDGVALVELATGDLEAATAAFERASASPHVAADPQLHADLLRTGVRLELARGEKAAGDAVSAALTALRAARAAGRHTGVVEACTLLADALERAGAASEAGELRRAATDRARLEAIVERLVGRGGGA